MFERKKYVLQKTAQYACCTIMILAILNQAQNLSNTNIPYTQEDLANNKKYVSELQEIRQETPIYLNKDLINELINQGIDINDPESVKSITITNTLVNSNISDLRYFPNLTDLHIENNDIDINDIKYNYNLLNLSISSSNISNIESLPNSIYNLNIQDSTISNGTLTIPYNTKYISLSNVPFNHLHFKNPSQVKKLSIVGNAFLDMNALKECTNLEHLKLIRVPNVNNSNILTTLPSLTNIELDDYAPIWLTKETYHALKLDNKQILDEIIILDVLTLDITEGCSTEEEQIKALTKYILEKLSYKSEFTKQELNDYNNNPINYALNCQEGLCINYASLFTAMANRLGIDTYQIYSSTHTWNMLCNSEITSFIDLTMLDTETIIKVINGTTTELAELPNNQTLNILNNNGESTLYHYKISLEELMTDPLLSNYSLLPNENPTISNNIGFIKNNGIAIEINNKLYFIEYSKLPILVMMITILGLFISLSRKDLNRPLLMSPEDTDYVLQKRRKKDKKEK